MSIFLYNVFIVTYIFVLCVCYVLALDDVCCLALFGNILLDLYLLILENFEVSDVALNKMNILNSVFTRELLRQFLNDSSSDSYDYIIKKYDLFDKTNLEVVKYIYKILEKEYRNEYYYKNTLLNKLLLGVHSIHTTTALSELPIANSKADFILINGKAVVYEIKTELDNFERLENQINDYYMAFDHVSVVTCEEKINSLQNLIGKINKPVGIYYIKNNGAISTVTKPGCYKESLNREVIFQLLRKSEYESIIMDYYNYLPDVSAFIYYRECKKMFLNISLDVTYNIVLQLLKKRIKVEEQCFQRIPKELKYLAYFTYFRKRDYQNLDLFLSKNCGGI